MVDNQYYAKCQSILLLLYDCYGIICKDRNVKPVWSVGYLLDMNVFVLNCWPISWKYYL